MPTTPIASGTTTTTTKQRGTRLRRAIFVFAALASLALLAAACGGSSADPAAKSGSTATHSHSSTQGGGVVTRPGPRSGSGSGNESVGGTFTLAFAKCMRAHGVAEFPNPDGQGGQLGPGSGINPASPAFEAAINGPCRPLAPPAWVSSGTVSKGGGS